MDFTSADTLSRYIQEIIGVAGLGTFSIQKTENVILVVGPGLTFTKTEENQQSAWSIGQVKKQLSSTQADMIQVSNEAFVTVTNWEELGDAITNIITHIHVRRVRFYHWYMKVLRPQYSPVKNKRHRMMQHLLDLKFLPLAEGAGRLLALLWLEATPDGKSGVLSFDTATQTLAVPDTSIQTGLDELKTYRLVECQMQDQHIFYTIPSPKTQQSQSA